MARDRREEPESTEDMPTERVQIDVVKLGLDLDVEDDDLDGDDLAEVEDGAPTERVQPWKK